MASLYGIDKFMVLQRITMMVNRYAVHAVLPDGTQGELLAVAQQKRMAFKEQVTFFTDDSRTTPVFSFKARQVMDLAATYDVMDAAGTPIGMFRKDFGKSLLRSTWHLEAAGVSAIGQERNQTVAPSVADATGNTYGRRSSVPAAAGSNAAGLFGTIRVPAVSGFAGLPT